MLLQVSVKPRARCTKFCQTENGDWVAHIKSPPVDGKANAELIALVAKHFGVKKTQVAIKGGSSGRKKWLQVLD